MTARTATKRATVTEQLASLDTPAMPAYLATKVSKAIAAESARRGFVTSR